MRKTKSMLTAITVFAIVGSALAFRINESRPNPFYTMDTSDGNCTLQVNLNYTTTHSGGSFLQVAIVETAGACPVTRVIPSA